MDHDLRYDADEDADTDVTHHDLPAVKPPAKEPDCTVWTQTVNHRLRTLELAVDRIADHVQVLILRLDDGK